MRQLHTNRYLRTHFFPVLTATWGTSSVPWGWTPGPTLPPPPSSPCPVNLPTSALTSAQPRRPLRRGNEKRGTGRTQTTRGKLSGVVNTFFFQLHAKWSPFCHLCMYLKQNCLSKNMSDEKFLGWCTVIPRSGLISRAGTQVSKEPVQKVIWAVGRHYRIISENTARSIIKWPDTKKFPSEGLLNQGESKFNSEEPLKLSKLTHRN